MKVLRFGAIWCVECLTMRPIWQKIEEEMPELETEYYDADESPDILKKYKADDIPVFVFLDKEGNEITRFKGMKKKEDIINIIKENLDK